MANRLGHGVGRLLFVSRWVLAPFYLALILALLPLAYVFLHELLGALTRLPQLDENQVIGAVLTLVDLTLVANLVVMVAFVGYENFVATFKLADPAARPPWLDHLDLSGLKQKLMASVVSITAIHLLKQVLLVTQGTANGLILETGVFLAFVVAGVLLALMDRLGSQSPG